MSNNGELFPCGIYTENSDIRAHVCAKSQKIYVFPTVNGIRAIEKYKPSLKSATQPGVNGAITGMGWLIKIEWIEDLRRINYTSWAKWHCFNMSLTTAEKGQLAVDCVEKAMRLGRFPFWLDSEEDSRKNVQIEGTDILVFCRKRVQVKCDLPGGDPPGTGNLFLQQAERNPLRKI